MPNWSVSKNEEGSEVVQWGQGHLAEDQVVRRDGGAETTGELEEGLRRGLEEMLCCSKEVVQAKHNPVLDKKPLSLASFNFLKVHWNAFSFTLDLKNNL